MYVCMYICMYVYIYTYTHMHSFFGSKAGVVYNGASGASPRNAPAEHQIALLASQRDYYISQAALLRQTGSLEVGAIMTGAQLHEPVTHLHEIMRKNAVPWEMIFRKIDKAGAPGAKRRPLSQTHGDSPAPSWTPAATPPTTRDLSRSLPIAPIRDPMDQPVSGYGKPNR